MKTVAKVFALAIIIGLSLTSCTKDNDVADTPPLEPGFPSVEVPAHPIAPPVATPHK